MGRLRHLYDRPRGPLRRTPPFEVIIHSWDLAATKGGGVFTVCTKFGLTKDLSGRDIVYLTGVVRMRVELPDVRVHIAALDEAEKPALIIMDGVGIGMCVYQDLIRQGLKHIMPSGSMQKENVGNLKAVRFYATVPALYDGLVRIPDAMPGLEIYLTSSRPSPMARTTIRSTRSATSPPTANT